jgi:peptidoglycan/xylan/chitin deacetylase (PgdA/CDA1 family)
MYHSRREFLAAAGGSAASFALPPHVYGSDSKLKKHIVTLSFDDGFKNSSIKTAEIYEKFKLSACINIVASAHMKDFRPPDYPNVPRGDFGLWNELKARGHEVMPHGYKHANKRSIPFAEAKDLILRCLDVFDKELTGFDRKQAVFNFPYNASTPELEKWLPSQVLAFRTGGGAINPLPHRGQVKLTYSGFGPGNCEAHLAREIERLLAKETGWLVYNTHSLDDEGWGPIRATYLEQLLERLLAIESVEILPAGKALTKYVS